MKKKIFAILMSISIVLSSIVISNAQTPAAPDITSEAGVLIDYQAKEILYNKNAFKKMYPASTTKVMTALLTLENCKNLDEIVNIDYDLSNVGGSSMYIKQGESFTVRQLLEFMLIRSANDATVALANHIGGSIDEFKDLMNNRAKELGCKTTHFNNPNGMPDENHYTSAYDLALIASEAMQHDEFRRIVKSKDVKLAPTEQTPVWRVYKNSNRFLWGTGGGNQINYRNQWINIKYDLIDGIKTGYTNAAGNCLISSGEKDGMRLVSVILKSQGSNVYLDSRTIIDFGFENYHFEQYISKDKVLGEKDIFFSKEKKLKYSLSRDIGFVVENGQTLDSLNLKYNIVLNEDIKPPLKSGDIVGYVEIYKADTLSSKENLISVSDLNSLSLLSMAKNIVLKLLKYLLILAASLISLCFMVRFVNINVLRKKRKKKNKNYKYYSKQN
ncbi:D-alanyl-D-alanine carboxypeptidase family protein [Peptoclostridium litorale]|uniref:serine-type D-Ala-D-Ala carboxypeptidase n=1 Tax=Peptoclostridium litorale DSM 5388 TaxID=1121324 RepID=A0A069RCW9_PEPLI|nr:D-alanyl-D-alanine carboxypeptidase family protein [Peptoclostridium litorale]KDR94090.1 D-alanyl-D-alanine carboxypeptidase DacB [Peptoclostridium litorale DSM 5388]